MNPHDVETCIHCHAKLTVVPEEGKAINARVERAAGAPQDWLRDLLAKSEAEREASTKPEPIESESPPGEETVPEATIPEGDDLDRLESLVSGLDKGVDQISTVSPSGSLTLPDDIDDTPAWLRPLQKAAEGEGMVPGVPVDGTSEGREPGWKPLFESTPDQQVSGITDWLKTLEKKIELEEKEGYLPGAEGSGEKDATTTEGTYTDLPGWLKEPGATGEGDERTFADGVDGSLEGEDSDWKPLPDNAPVQEPPGITDWLKVLEQKIQLEEETGVRSSEGDFTGEGSGTAEGPDMELPDWLKEPSSDAAADQQTPVETNEETKSGIPELPAENIPGWMKILDQPLEHSDLSATKDVTGITPEAETAKSFETHLGEELEPGTDATTGFDEETRKEAIPEGIDAATMGWLSRLGSEDLQVPTDEPTHAGETVVEEVSAGEAQEDQLQFMEGTGVEVDESTGDHEGLGAEREVVPPQEALPWTERPGSEAKEPSSEEAPAQQPVPEDDTSLSGLPLIPVENISLQYRKPPVYSSRLKISDKENASAEVLEKMVSGERNSRQIKPRPGRLPQKLASLASIIVLVAVLLVPILIGTSTVAAPAPGPSTGTEELYKAVENLPANATVLLAADYQPGYAGEMYYAAGAVVEHLMRKQATLVVVSTTPSGPVLAGDLIQRTLGNLEKSEPAAIQAYQAPGSIINLGYLAGGLASIQEFALQPRKASLYGFSAGVNDPTPWESPNLRGIETLRDFTAVVVMCDSDDSGRAWIEQAQPHFGGQGLFVISSAQAGPMLSPYLFSGQVAGLAAGLPGGMAYQRHANPQARLTPAPISFRYGMLIGAIFLVVGLFLSILISLFSPKGQAKMEGK